MNNTDFLSIESISFNKTLSLRATNEQFKFFLLSNIRYTRRENFFKFLLLVSGDISLNPGPTRHPCAVCEKGVRKGVLCSHCNLWVHQTCEGISNTEYKRLSKIPKDKFSYTCSKCTVSDVLPFYDIPLESPVELNNDDFSINELNINQDIWSPFRKRGLHFLHININSILPKIDEVRQIAKLSDASIIGISESKLDETVLEGEICIDGYELVRADRNRNGGGVACYIKSELAFNQRKDFSMDIENIFFDILLPNSKPILVGIIYRPPDQPGFLSKLTDAIKGTENFEEQEVYILGDFNINLLHKKTLRKNYPKYYTEFCSLHGLKQLITSPTRVTQNTSTLLDHVLTNSSDRTSQSGTLEIGISDHMLTYCTRKITHTKSFDHKYIHIRSLKKYTEAKYIQALKDINFPDYTKSNSVDEAYDDFIAKLIGVIDEIAPSKKVRIKGNTQDWFDDEIHIAIKSRDKRFSVFKKSKLCEDKLAYKRSQNYVQCLIKKKKSSL